MSSRRWKKGTCQKGCCKPCSCEAFAKPGCAPYAIPSAVHLHGSPKLAIGIVSLCQKYIELDIWIVSICPKYIKLDIGIVSIYQKYIKLDIGIASIYQKYLDVSKDLHVKMPALRWIQKILHDPKYTVYRELWCYSILRSCRIFSINSS